MVELSGAHGTPGRVIVVGASGVVGCAAVDGFSAAGWDVVAWSRRRPQVQASTRFTHVAADLRDANATRSAIEDLPPITHVVYAALHELEDLVGGWEQREQMETNLAMLRNVIEPLVASHPLRHLSVLQGTKAYGSHLHDIRVPSRESQPRDDHENFYWLQEDYLIEVADRTALAHTIFRPQLVIGSAIGVAMNPIPVIGAYAALCRELDRPCGFPGGPAFVWQAVDSRLLADGFVWAATNPDVTKGETYNITNGEVFGWRDLWPSLVSQVGATPGPDDPTRLVDFFADHEATWQRVVDRHALRPTTLADLLGKAHQAADYYFAFGQERPRTKLLSTVKIRRAGFASWYDTEDSFSYWLRDLQEQRVLPHA